jgi:hypothetical protein
MFIDAYKCKKILQINKQTNKVIREFNSVSEAANFTKAHIGNISKVLRGERTSTAGYV